MKITEDGEIKCGYIDRDGAIAVPLEFDEAYAFSDGLALVGKRGDNG